MESHEAADAPRAAPNTSDGQAVVVVVWGNAVVHTLNSVERKAAKRKKEAGVSLLRESNVRGDVSLMQGPVRLGEGCGYRAMTGGSHVATIQ
jgi:hypothetical protein